MRRRGRQLGAALLAFVGVGLLIAEVYAPTHGALGVLDAVIDGGAGYAKGNRLAWPGARDLMPLQRFAGNHVLSALTRVATQTTVADSQCGYSVLHRDAAAALDLETLWPRYGYPNDLLAQCAARGVRVVDVPVRPVYRDEVSGIGWRHALVVVPYVLGCGVLRRLAADGGPPGVRRHRGVARPERVAEHPTFASRP